MVYLNGDIENNKKYKKVFDRYLASPSFSDKCKELKKTIKAQELEDKRAEKEEKAKLRLF